MRGDDVTVIWDNSAALSGRSRRARLGGCAETSCASDTSCTTRAGPRDAKADRAGGRVPVANRWNGARTRGRRQYNAWHQALHHSVSGLFAALASGDRASLTRSCPTPSCDVASRRRWRPSPPATRPTQRPIPMRFRSQRWNRATAVVAHLASCRPALAASVGNAGAMIDGERPGAGPLDRYDPVAVEARWYPLWESRATSARSRSPSRSPTRSSSRRPTSPAPSTWAMR